MPLTLKEIRARLRRRLTARSAGGFEYEALFGCDKKVAFCTPHVLVRVELRHQKEDFFCFKTFIDFHLPIGADIESAKLFKEATIAAVRKARWATDLVEGLQWTREEVTNSLQD